jgi:hypothetical protein
MPVDHDFNRDRKITVTMKIGSSSTNYANALSGSERGYKSGTLRRRKPANPDQTAYERRVENVVFPVGTGVYTQSDGVQRIVSPVISGNSTMTTQSFISNLAMDFTGNILDLANLKALKKFNQKDLDSGTAWKERGKTVDLVRGVAQTAAEALRDIARRDGRGLLNTLGLDHQGARGRGVVDASLAYWYGLRPMLHDVHGATTALARLPSDLWQLSAKGTMADEREKEITVFSTYPTTIPVLAQTVNRESSRVVIKGIQVPLTREQDRLWSLGLDDPASTAWELTPYSFVADWMIPIGDWLQALNSVKYYSGWETCATQYISETCKWSNGSSTMFGAKQSSSCRGHAQRLRVKRTIMGTVPLIGLPVKDPRSVTHMAQALSLLASRSANSADLPRFIRY